MAIHVLGIRHHGPGSARNVKAFLELVNPDILLVEGPPEADGILSWASNNNLKPPVAILCYQPDNPQRSSFYPFAEFSPEWQAIKFAVQNKIHIRFMDLPVAHSFAIKEEERKKHEEEYQKKEAEDNPNNIVSNAVWHFDRHWFSNSELAKETENDEMEQPIRLDPIAHLAFAAGYEDGEKWWEHMFEHRHNNEEIFDAVAEAMSTLRTTIPQKEDRMEQLREAYMRKTIRQAEKEMFQNIVVICGAWHAPALQKMPSQKEDDRLLKGLPKVKVECTWIPWTYNRLSFYSGYGAGIASPGWYEHIWNHPKDDGTLWMAKVARLFRQKQMDTSVSHVIEAIRLANALAALRNLPKAGLEEMNETILSVLCNGENIMMGLVNHELIVSDKIGEVPLDIPKPPLQLDIEKLQKRLRLPATADWKDYTFDLRKENDLERSVFLHRLQLLEIKWGNRSDVNSKGTFKEQWRLQWEPELSVHIIEKGTWGNTVEEAASGFIKKRSAEAISLPVVCELLEAVIPAELPSVVETLIQRINNLAATSGDVIQLMEVIPGLVNISRYGNVRKTDAELVFVIAENMITRICVSLPAACTAVDEDAAITLLDLIAKLNEAVNLIQDEEIITEWQKTLQNISANKNTSPVIAGYATRLLTDYKLLAGDELVKAFYYSMSTATAPAIAAAWLEGFLKGSGTLLLLDQDLWNLVNNWIEQLDEDTFMQVLPLLRRTFANFSKPERRKLGEKVKQEDFIAITKNEIGLDEEKAKRGIDVVMKLLGYK